MINKHNKFKYIYVCQQEKEVIFTDLNIFVTSFGIDMKINVPYNHATCQAYLIQGGKLSN